jgi:hypothetical protein
MDFHGIDMKGDFLIEEVADKDFVPVEEKRLIYDLSEKKAYYGNDSQWVEISSAVTDIPSGETILFEKDTVVTGYTLETDFDDGVVYVTSGGQPGDTGTWTFPSHSHPTSGAALTEAQLPNVTGSFEIWRTSVVGETQVHNPQGAFSISISPTTDNSVDYQGDVRNRDIVSLSFGSGQEHDHGNTGDAVGASTWRPKGKNYTRQTRI